MSHEETGYLDSAPITITETLEVSAVPTVVVVYEDYAMANMNTAFDSAFQALFPAMAQAGVNPVGPPFSLYHRMPTDSVTFEVGVPVDRALDQELSTESGLTVKPSILPAGRIARFSHIGSFDGLGVAWAAFMEDIATSGNAPSLPFWEVYMTEPSPEADPATMRTDLYTLLQ